MIPSGCRSVVRRITNNRDSIASERAPAGQSGLDAQSSDPQGQSFAGFSAWDITSLIMSRPAHQKEEGAYEAQSPVLRWRALGPMLASSWLREKEKVVRETPARSATCWLVTLSFFPTGLRRATNASY
jgi:hypothetical protein